MKILFTDRRYSDTTTVVVECKKLQVCRHGQNDGTIKFWDMDDKLYRANHVSMSQNEESFIRASLMDNSYINLSMYDIEEV